MKIIYSSTWALVKGVQVMQVDNINAVGMNFSGLPSNLFMAEWKEGRGELETTDAPGLRTIFTDVTPYVTYFQQFMTILNGLGQLTLAQAQKIQNDLCTTLFDDKRQATFPYTVSAGAYNWSTSDTEIAAMSLEAIPFISGSGTSGITTLVSQINAMIDQINNNIVNPGTHNSGQAGSLAATHNANANNSTVLNNVLNGSAFPNLASRTLAITGGGGTATTAATPGLGAPGATVTTGASFTTSGAGFNDFTNIAHIGGGGGGGPANIPWSPIGAAAPVMLTMADITGLMSGISSRRQSLLNTRNIKQSAINALATIAAVIAYDVTAGW